MVEEEQHTMQVSLASTVIVFTKYFKTAYYNLGPLFFLHDTHFQTDQIIHNAMSSSSYHCSDFLNTASMLH